MAIVKTAGGAVLRLVLQTGVNTEGKPVLRNKNLDGLKATAPDQDVYDVGQALGALQKHSVNKIMRMDSAELTNE